MFRRTGRRDNSQNLGTIGSSDGEGPSESIGNIATLW